MNRHELEVMLCILFQISADLMLDLVNTQRRQFGAGILHLDADCMAAAKAHTVDQASHLFMGHIGSKGSTVGDRVTASGFKWDAVAENVAVGQNSVEEVVTAWMNSPGHRENLLNTAYDRFGYAQATGSDGKIYWTQNFARAMSGFKPLDIVAPPTASPPKEPVENSVIDYKPPPTTVSARNAEPTIDSPDVQLTEVFEAPSPTSNNKSIIHEQVSENANSKIESHKFDSNHANSVSPRKTNMVSTFSNIVNTPTSDNNTTLNIIKISSHLPRIIYSMIPTDIQKIAEDAEQYSVKIVRYLKPKTPSAEQNADYYEQHPGLKSDDKYGKTAYAKYPEEFSSATGLETSLLAILLVVVSF